MKNKSDLVDYLYTIIINIRDFDLKTKFFIKHTKIVNVYDQVINREYRYLVMYTKKRKTIENIS